MFFDALMFEHNNQLKLEIFHSLATHSQGEYSVKYFAKLHHLTYHQLSRAVEEIDCDISQEMNKEGEEWLPILQKNGKIFIQKQSLKIDEYRYHLLLHSIPFLFLEEILQGNGTSVEEFCKKRDIGRSTLYRRLEKLKKFLAGYQIKITYQPCDLVGDEAVIRLILNFLYWIGTRGLEMPSFALPEVAEAIFRKNVLLGKAKYNYVTSKQTMLDVYIALARIQSGHFCSRKKEWAYLFKNYQPFQSEIIQQFPFLSEESFQNEIHYWYHQFFVKQSYSSVLDSVMQDFLRLFTMDYPNHPVTKICCAFLNYALQKVGQESFEDEPRQILLASLLSITFTYYVYGMELPDLERLSTGINVENKLKKKVTQDCHAFFELVFSNERYQRLYPAKEALIRRFANLIFPFYHKYSLSEQVFVGIALEDNPILQDTLRIFLARFGFIKSEAFEEKSAGAYDLVVYTTSAILLDFPQIKAHYTWDIGYGEAEMDHLHRVLYEMYVEKTNGLVGENGESSAPC